jgi:hypothetical protein
MDYQIESKPIPKRSGTKRLDYPIEKLTPGSEQSFLVPAEGDDVRKVKASIRTFAYRNDLHVTLRQEDNGVRVWRTVNA